MNGSSHRHSLRDDADTFSSGDRPAVIRHWTPRGLDAAAHVARARRLVLTAAARAGALLCLVSVPVLLLWLDIQWLHNTVGEFSVTELGQLALLAATVLAWLYLARRSVDDRRLAVLAAGFFACMLIRECDAALDLVMDGLWQILATLVALACLTYSLSDWRSTLHGMARLAVSRISLVLFIGLAILLAYSRLFGMGVLWQGLLDDQYLRVFKNAAEETSELLGYFLIAAASVGYVMARLRRRARPKLRRRHTVVRGQARPGTRRPPRPAREPGETRRRASG